MGSTTQKNQGSSRSKVLTYPQWTDTRPHSDPNLLHSPGHSECLVHVEQIENYQLTNITIQNMMGTHKGSTNTG